MAQDTLTDGLVGYYPFNGSANDVRIYDRALTSEEVAGLYALESACAARRATAIATVVNGFVVGATITDGGCGCTDPPLVIVSGSGNGATASATLNNGTVTGITMNNAGSGYGEDTVIRIASPPFSPFLDIAVSEVAVTLHVVLGRSYVLLASPDLTRWTQVG